MSNLRFILLYLGAVVAALLVPFVFPNLSGARCAISTEDRESCIYRMAEAQLERAGVAAALETVRFAYADMRLLKAEDCHLLVHRLGDAAFYRSYYGNPAAAAELKDLPQGLTLCRWGLMHGLLEHLVQNTPEPGFIDALCPAVAGGTARKACHLASGHGLALAKVDTLSESSWGDIDAFAEEPVEQCARLSGSLPRQECINGVFVKIFEWARGGEFGFSWDAARPFALCEGNRPETWRLGCYRAVVVTFPDYFARYDTEEFLSYFDPLTDPFTHGEVLERAIFHLAASRSESPIKALSRCETLPGWLFSSCIVGAVDGAFSDDSAPRWQRARAEALCASALVAKHGAEAYCTSRLDTPFRTS